VELEGVVLLGLVLAFLMEPPKEFLKAVPSEFLMVEVPGPPTGVVKEQKCR
jgi:hypothetical protein